jgi:hypothetical protein
MPMLMTETVLMGEKDLRRRLPLSSIEVFERSENGRVLPERFLAAFPHEDQRPAFAEPKLEM